MEDSFNEQDFTSLVDNTRSFKKKGKHRIMPPSKLALTKTLRRSSMYDRLIPSLDNSKINVVDADSTETTSSVWSSDKAVKPRKGFIVVDDSESEATVNNVHKNQAQNVIVDDSQSSCESLKQKIETSLIIEASDDEDEIPVRTETSIKNVETCINNDLNIQNLEANEHLSEAKLECIKNWLQSVRNPVDKCSVNTEVSPECEKPSNGKVKQAINSTFALDRTCVPFHEWMTSAQKTNKQQQSTTKKQENNKKNKAIQDTPNKLMKKYLESTAVKDLLRTESINEKNLKGVDVKVKSKPLKNSTDNAVEGKNKGNILKMPSLNRNPARKNTKDLPIPSDNKIDDVLVTPVKQIISRNDDAVKLLDTLYGNSWHKNKDQILSEPRPQKKIQIDKLKEPRTEKKPSRGLLYKNPYLDSEKEKATCLLKALQQQRVMKNFESPFFARPEYVDDYPSPVYVEATKMDKIEMIKGRARDDNVSIPDSNSDVSLESRTKKKSLPKPTQLNFDEDEHSNKPIKQTYKRVIIISDSDNDNDSDSDSYKSKSNPRAGSTSSFSTNSDDSGIRRPVGKTTKKTQKQKTDSDDLAERIDNITIDDASAKADSDADLIARLEVGSAITKTRVPQSSKIPSFLASLSKNIPDEKCDPSALIFKNNYKKHRDALLRKLFDLFNEKIFDKCIAPDTQIEWSARMTGTAGLCRCFRRTSRDGKVSRYVKLNLSTKVLDSADRLRDTLVHEMCHAATFLVNEVSDGHGSYWKAWAAKAMRAFPELPPIKRCHDYAVHHKYTYKCTNCGYSFGRHSKSLDVERKRCGHCYGKFEVLLNKVNQNGTKKSVMCTPKKEVTGFAKFIKDNYALHKSPGVKHADLMKYLGKKYAETKGTSN